MICDLLVKVATLCGIFYTYHREPIAHKTRQLLSVNDHIECFVQDHSPRFMGEETRLFLLEKGDHDYPVVYNKHLDFTRLYQNCKHAKKDCEEEEEDEEEEWEERKERRRRYWLKKLAKKREEERKTRILSLLPTRNPSWPKPTSFNPGKRAFLKDRMHDLKASLLSGKLSSTQLTTVVKQINTIKRQVAKENVKAAIQKQRDFQHSKKGLEALVFCTKLGVKGNALKGCLQDMQLTGGNKTVAAKSAKLTQKALNVNKKVSIVLPSSTPVFRTVLPNRVSVVPTQVVYPHKPSVPKVVNINTPERVVKAVVQPIIPKKVLIPAAVRSAVTGKSRVCTATGDPHFTNFNGDYFHLQEPSIFTIAKSKDGLFEVQVKQDGAKNIGDPSYVRLAKIRYGNNIYTFNFNAGGFLVSQSGSSLSITVPGSYEGLMMGVCGEDTPIKGAHNFKGPNGVVMDVDYGKPNWEMGGHGGPDTKLSKWHLSWKPSLDQCMFGLDECKKNLAGNMRTVAKRVVKKSLRRRG